MRVYLDNAATTPLAPEVIQAMLPVMENIYGNPSSVHLHGRQARALIEKSRKQIASLIHAHPSEIFFTSGGTEADNLVFRSAIKNLGIRTIITSPIEHHAVSHTAEEIAKELNLSIKWLNVNSLGQIDLVQLEELLKTNTLCLVSLMHANNEIGTLLPLKKVSELCQKYNAFFHSDTVQTMGHYAFDMKAIKIHFLACSAHKFHGPKGVGFIYINSDLKINPQITGGAQERNMRAGTENIYGIVGMAKAFEIAYQCLSEHQKYIGGLKKYMIEELEKNIPGVEFNGDAKGSSIYTVLSVRFPSSEINEMFLYKLDIEGISASGGSACSSGSNVESHVIRAIHNDSKRPSIRFSFSRYNTKEEIDYTVNKIKEFYSIQ
ncbi:MAG: cysteine desulfurase [Bacteroidetes bacterium]|jgi:cysteine desulfurase|nr:cysteine desulfurase [Bacteroidota bacterium]MBV6460043.1 Cysteine desulfurase NifS [Flavobacteriales bacterium]WKZ76661.1 MAG: cysteine desulfurase family protein [Vicingaceae bacterium]MCL4816393.1 cysteine desulfurase [Flavobacteriales bacterium]NOG95468.1 cysteine desulfurase [Bacteroidota bacterium]